MGARSWMFAAVLATAAPGTPAQSDGRSGQEVFDSVCAACHATGANGAPRIGDHAAWSKRAAQGLSGLTDHALNGIRQMPAHGGEPGLSNLEIGRAVTYMVNRSGGHWIEPASPGVLAAKRGGAEVVKLRCAECHQTGKGGAPRIGDRDAWVPRMSGGIDPLVHSAIRGHGGMPPRGGQANLSDAELRSAIQYMFNPDAPAGTGR